MTESDLIEEIAETTRLICLFPNKPSAKNNYDRHWEAREILEGRIQVLTDIIKEIT
jgi:hypothetical protein